MRYRFIDHPRPVEAHIYDLAVSRMIERLGSWPGVSGVYGVGGTADPGISDIDLIVIFDEGVRCGLDPRAGLSRIERYLFVHGLGGTSRSLAARALAMPHFKNRRLLRGRGVDDEAAKAALDMDAVRTLKRQIALEYLVKLWITLTVERAYGIVKLRSLLLLAKGVRYDLEYLGIGSGPVFEMVGEAERMRGAWFESEHPERRAVEWLDGFYPELVRLIDEEASAGGFYLPVIGEARVARNMRIAAGPLGHVRRGVLPPRAFSALGKRYFNLMHRFSEFEFSVPYKSVGLPPALAGKFALEEEMARYNARHIRHFSPIGSSLNLIRVGGDG